MGYFEEDKIRRELNEMSDRMQVQLGENCQANNLKIDIQIQTSNTPAVQTRSPEKQNQRELDKQLNIQLSRS